MSKFHANFFYSVISSLLHLEKIEEAEALKEKYSKLGHAV